VVFVNRIGEALDVALAGGEASPLETDAHPPVVPRVPPEAPPPRRNASS